MKLVLRLIPFGPALVDKVKERLKFTNADFRQQLPEKELEQFAHNQFLSGHRLIFVGHFHRAKCLKGSEGRRLYTVPSWYGQGHITHFDERTGKIKHVTWTKFLE